MFLHYLKIAFRNMLKYKNQTLISVIGLAVGFTCFALATLWIRYEMTFDSFHKNAKQMYVVYKPNLFNSSGYGRSTPNPLAAYLKETFPEIADAIPLIPAYPGSTVTVDGVELSALTIRTDSSFFRMFDVKILEGNLDFLISGNKNIAITQEKARQFFGNEHPIGKKVNFRNEDLTICAIVTSMSKRSNYPFDFIAPFAPYAVDPGRNWNSSGGENTIIELISGINVEAFEKKLYEHETGSERDNIKNMTIKPLTELHYTDPDLEREVEFKNILIFSISGLLVILCALFNYLTLFLSRFRIRQKEMALRVVCGASEDSLLAMLSVEFILTLLFAVLLGCTLTQWLHKPFLTLSNIQANLPAIYRETLMYIGSVILISLLAFWLILFIFRRRSLNQSIRQSNKALLRKGSIVVQLIISIGFSFCTIIILKQIYFLHHSADLGFSFQNRATIQLRGSGDSEAFVNQLKQIPEITEIVEAKGMVNIVSQSVRSTVTVRTWDDEPANAEAFPLLTMYVSPEYNAFYDFRLVAGEMLTDSDPHSMVLINESAVKVFGWYEPVGKRFLDYYMVKGIIKDVYNFAPTIPAKPVCYFIYPSMGSGNSTVLFKYREGMWKSCKEKIEKMIKNEFTGLNYTMFDTEEEYKKFMKSENALIKLLSFVSAICVLICVFGFVSLVSLTCEERRKEIAIRKISGATAGDILAMFAKEYFLLLIVGAVISFTVGYYIIQRWLEHYVLRTSIPAWIYFSIIFVLALVIVLCVGWQVWRASVENPAEVVKSE